MMQELDNDLAKEIFTYLAYFDSDMINDIPGEILRNITLLASDSNKDYYVDKSKSLMEQNMSPGCKDFISALFFSSLANEIEKNELIETWYNNEAIQ